MLSSDNVLPSLSFSLSLLSHSNHFSPHDQSVLLFPSFVLLILSSHYSLYPFHSIISSSFIFHSHLPSIISSFMGGDHIPSYVNSSFPFFFPSTLHLLMGILSLSPYYHPFSVFYLLPSLSLLLIVILLHKPNHSLYFPSPLLLLFLQSSSLSTCSVFVSLLFHSNSHRGWMDGGRERPVSLPLFMVPCSTPPSSSYFVSNIVCPSSFPRIHFSQSFLSLSETAFSSFFIFLLERDPSQSR